MLTLKSLTFSGIGRFVEEQTIDFTQLGNLVQVDGQNNNTGGSSGAGKSTIFKALDFLLGLSDLSTLVLQSRLTKESLSVTGLFELDGISLKIQRNKKLLIDLNGEIITGSSKLTEEKLDQIVGMPRDLFRKILHKRQGEGGFFLDLGPSETHKFLTSCLGLQKEQDKIAVLDDILKALSDKEIALKSDTEANRMALDATLKASESQGMPPEQLVSPKAMESLKLNATSACDLHKQLKALHKTEMERLESTRPQITTVPFDRSKIITLEEQVGTILAQIANLEKVELNRQSEVKSRLSEIQIRINNENNKEKVRQAKVKAKLDANRLEAIKANYLVNEGMRAKSEAIELAKELQKIRASVCPTCEQTWVTDAAKTKESNILLKLQDHKKIVMSGTEASKKGQLLDAEFKQLEIEKAPQSIPFMSNLTNLVEQLTEDAQSQLILEAIELSRQKSIFDQMLGIERKEELDHQFKENAKSQAIVVEFAQKQTKLRQEHEKVDKELQHLETLALSQYEHAKSQLESFEAAKKRYNDASQKLTNQTLIYKKELDAKTSQLVLTQEEIELVIETKKVIKSYLSCSFEDALDSIGDQATKFIRNIPNMATATIQFEGLKETKEGKVKEEVTCLISIDGEVGIPIKSLSGGERSSTDLAIDLAVIKFIEERTGKGVDLFVLDEPFTGLDSKNILEALEMLRECSVDKRLLIVDHNPEAAQSIENRLLVVRNGLTSKIIQQ